MILGSGEGSTMSSYYSSMLGRLYLEDYEGQVIFPEWKKVGVLSQCSQAKLQEKDVSEDLGVEGRTVLEWILKK